jgi:hypothetical protein
MDEKMNIYVPELQARMSILNIEGQISCRWGGEESREPGKFIAPHCACVDSKNNLYIGEVKGGQRIQKFELQR